jgi:alpha-glucosidase
VAADPWWRDAVVYQVYPRSFMDTDGNGVGDLRGLEQRLDHIASLGADALWLSPIYPSPLADFGYDVADHAAVDPVYGTMEDLDRLVAAAHGRGLRILLDLVPSHTSIDHPWFREHPDRYVWADRPPNNWLATFGGPAWTLDPERGRYYLHRFYPEQPDLDWSNPEVVAAMQGVMRGWLERGIDGFRCDAVLGLARDELLRDDPPRTAPFGLPQTQPYGALDHIHSANGPGLAEAFAALREAAGDALLVGEVYLPSRRCAFALRWFDLVFVFELIHAPWTEAGVRSAVEGAIGLRHGDQPGAAWVLSNHDFPRTATRYGAAAARAAAIVLLTLPGTAFVYQGEELGLEDGPGADPPLDRAGRDGARHPMPWTPGTHGGFTTGTPWLSVQQAPTGSVSEQEADGGSVLHLYRDLIALRPALGRELEFVPAAPGVLAYRRGAHIVAVSFAGDARPLPVGGEAVVATSPGAVQGGALAAGAAVVMCAA